MQCFQEGEWIGGNVYWGFNKPHILPPDLSRVSKSMPLDGCFGSWQRSGALKNGRESIVNQTNFKYA